MISFTKLRSGNWGVRASFACEEGETVNVTLRSGETKPAVVGRLVWSGEDARNGGEAFIYAVADGGRRSQPRRDPKSVQADQAYDAMMAREAPPAPAAPAAPSADVAALQAQITALAAALAALTAAAPAPKPAKPGVAKAARRPVPAPSPEPSLSDDIPF